MPGLAPPRDFAAADSRSSESTELFPPSRWLVVDVFRLDLDEFLRFIRPNKLSGLVNTLPIGQGGERTGSGWLAVGVKDLLHREKVCAILGTADGEGCGPGDQLAPTHAGYRHLPAPLLLQPLEQAVELAILPLQIPLPDYLPQLGKMQMHHRSGEAFNLHKSGKIRAHVSRVSAPNLVLLHGPDNEGLHRGPEQVA